MKITAAENIPLACEAFSELGEVSVFSGREVPAGLVRESDILLVRSTTRVDESLLKGSSVRFVATATIGFDHVDVDYLKRRGIGFTTAAGSNANSVAEYIVTALLILARRRGLSLSEQTLGVVGIGNVGSLVVRKAETIGMQVLQNDPPLERRTGEKRFRPLDELLEQADILSFHIPLVREGADATYHIADKGLLGRMKRGSFLFNTSRGAVVDSQALLRALAAGRPAAAVLDVWEGEPQLDTGIVKAVELGTPHIAGHSYDGKINSTVMIHHAACEHFHVQSSWQPPALPLPSHPVIEVPSGDAQAQEVLTAVTTSAYDLEADDRALRRMCEAPAKERPALFDSFRKGYAVRREFRGFKVDQKRLHPGTAAMLQELGFQLAG